MMLATLPCACYMKMTKPLDAGNAERLLTATPVQEAEMADQPILKFPSIVTRAEAKNAGLSKYFTGKPCTKGHIAERRTESCSCVECQNLIVAKYREKNRELVNERTRVWRALNPERCAEMNRASRKALYDKNPEKFRAKSKAFREAYPEKSSAWVKKAKSAWVKAHPEMSAIYARNRRAKKKNAEGTHTIAEIRNLFSIQKGKCAMCMRGIKLKFHADHIVPLALGGGNGIRNIQLLCPPCNLKKGAKDPITFAQRLGLLV
jgi:5-methylcytosine-specific restriction endonuclease McrA